ncbi:FecCD family ABC transporter permease [Antarcticirhabdus aurantiaca]|uniref:Iron ABC transporter permease n=1 Tax=Antarcticirhabdus aurantiaca TaxID=2606717 RepID=A0ACD4NM62_9HYPH|nr:iron ABC transporter permease [Antarcticirhabdus aurantiaca]WAJ28015.1 iron ABC transporter permease [Jeongeuplla avenae]
MTAPGSGAGPGSGAAERIRAAHRRTNRRRWILVAAAGLVSVLLFLLDLVSGPAGLALGDAVAALTGGAVDPTTLVIVQSVRLPAALTALLVGAALAVSGAELQTLFDNPLAEGATLGVAPAAALGAAAAIVLGFGIPGVPTLWLVPANAFLFALGAMLILQGIARERGHDTQTLVLVGIALVFTFNALLSLLLFVASQQALQQLVFWLLGSLAGARWDTIAPVAAVTLLVLPLSFAQAWKLTALRLGAERAASFGMDLPRLRFFALARVSLLTGAAVSIVGTVGFVGLVGPHIARILVGEDHRFFLPMSALVGAALVSAASIAAKSILPGVVIPIGIVTSLIGLPIFFSLILSRRG